MNRYTLKEACKIMNVSYTWVIKAIKENRIQYHRLSARKIFFTDADIEANLNACLVLPKEA